MRKIIAALAATAALAAPTLAAEADTLGTFHYDMPTGWKPCKPAAATQTELCFEGHQSKILVVTKLGDAKDPKAIIAKIAANVGQTKELKAVDAPVGGKPGHIVVYSAGKDGEAYLAVSVTTEGDGLVVMLVSPKAEFKAAVDGWARVSDHGVLGGAGAPPTPAGQHDVTLENLADTCSAPVLFDGKQYTIPPKGVQHLSVAPGPHTFQWQDPDGSFKKGTGDVPKVKRFTASCHGNAVEAPPPGTSSGTQLLNGARSAVTFYRYLWNLSAGANDWKDPPNLDRLALRAINRVPKSKWGEFAAYPSHLATLKGAMDRAKSPDAVAKLRRTSAVTLLSLEHFPVPKPCQAKKGDAEIADCTVQAMSAADREEILYATNNAVVDEMPKLKKLTKEHVAAIEGVGK